MFARLVPTGASYGIGDGPAVKETDVAGRPGRLIDSGAARSLGWVRADGSIVHLIAVDVSPADLVEAGRAIEEAAGKGGPPPTGLPGGIELRRTTPSDTSPASLAEVSYESGPRSVGLRLTTGGTNRLDNLLLDRLASSGGWRPATVNGRSAVLSTYQEAGVAGLADQPRTLMWSMDDGVVAELTAQGLTEAEIEEVAASIREVDPGEWDGLMEQATARQSVPVPGAAERDALHGEVARAICQARNVWLRAVEAGDADVEATAVADLEAVLEKGRTAGLGETGDILVVAERLLEAMAAGDSVAVSSTPEGGACS